MFTVKWVQSGWILHISEGGTDMCPDQLVVTSERRENHSMTPGILAPSGVGQASLGSTWPSPLPRTHPGNSCLKAGG